jgi:lysyl-tRNA synthetase class I
MIKHGDPHYAIVAITHLSKDTAHEQTRQTRQAIYEQCNTVARWRSVYNPEDVRISYCSRPAFQSNMTNTVAEIKG